MYAITGMIVTPQTPPPQESVELQQSYELLPEEGDEVEDQGLDLLPEETNVVKVGTGHCQYLNHDSCSNRLTAPQRVQSALMAPQKKAMAVQSNPPKAKGNRGENSNLM